MESFVPRNRTAEYFERMNARKTQAKTASLDDEVRRQNFAANIDKLVREYESQGGSLNTLARDSQTEFNTIKRWRKTGTTRDNKDAVANFCKRLCIEPASMWESEIRYRPKTPDNVLAEAWADVSDYLKTNPSPTDLEFLRRTIRTLRQ